MASDSAGSATVLSFLQSAPRLSGAELSDVKEEVADASDGDAASATVQRSSAAEMKRRTKASASSDDMVGIFGPLDADPLELSSEATGDDEFSGHLQLRGQTIRHLSDTGSMEDSGDFLPFEADP